MIRFFLIVLFFISLFAHAQNQNISKLDIQSAIYLMLQKSQSIAISKIELEDTSLEVIKEKTIYEPTLNANYTYNDDNSYDDSLHTSTSSLEVSQKYNPGTTLTLGTKHELYNYTFDTTSDNQINQVFIKIEQPLLKGYGDEINSIDINTQLIDKKTKEAEITNKYLTEINEIQNLFFKYVKTIETRQIREKSHELSQKLLSKKQLEAKLGGFPKANLLELEGDVYEKEIALINAQNKESQEYLSLSNKLQLSDELEKELKIIYNTNVEFEVINYKNLMNVALQNRFEYLKNENELKKFKLKNIYFKNNTLPSLDLSLKYGKKTRSVGDNGIIGNEFNHNEVEIGVDFSMPIYQTKSKSELMQNSIKIKKTLLEKEQIRLKIKKELKLAIQDLEVNKKLIQRNQLRYNQQIELMKVEGKKLENNLIKITDYLTKQQKFINAQLDFKLSFINYKISKINLDKVIGKLPSFVTIVIKDSNG